MLDFELEPTFKAEARILIAGVGTAGVHMVDFCLKQELDQAKFLAIDSCWQSLQHSCADEQIVLGSDVTRGLGTSGNLALARRAFQGCEYLFDTLFTPYDLVFVVTGLGGGTGTVATSLVAAAAKRQGPLTVIIATKPFSFQERTREAEEALEELEYAGDALILLDNDKALIDEDTPRPIEEVLRRMNGEVLQIIKSLSQLVTLRRSTVATQDIIRVDFNDIRTIMGASGQAHIGFGVSSAVENRGILAVEQALKEVVSGSSTISGARGLLVSFLASPNISIVDIECAIERIVEEIGEHVDTNIIYGVTTSTALQDKIEVMVIATGFSSHKDEKKITTSNVQSESSIIPTSTAAYAVYGQLFKHDSLEAPTVVRKTISSQKDVPQEDVSASKSPLPLWMLYPRR